MANVVPIITVDAPSADAAWIAHKALAQAVASHPELANDPLWQHFQKLAYARFEQSFEVL